VRGGEGLDVSAQTVPQVEQRTVAPSDIHVGQGFNPRDRFEQKKLDQPATSIAIHGLLQALVVAENADGYRMIAGERRCRPAQLAGVDQVPVVVRQPGQGSSGLELDRLEHRARRAGPGRGGQRLPAADGPAGPHPQGVAEHLGIAQTRITKRLQILELPEQLHPKLAAGEIPPAAVKALVQLASCTLPAGRGARRGGT
jgi:ParB family chromosome partitioning protein